MPSTIKTPILRMLVNVYGHLGYCLHPISLTNVTSVARLALNVVVCLGLYYFVKEVDAFQIAELLGMLQMAKPFFALMIRLCFMYAGIGFYFTGLLYFGVVGRRLVALLDSPCFHAVYSSRRRAKSTFLLGVACNTAIWVLNDVPHIWEIYTSTTALSQFIVAIGCLYIICTLSYCVIFLVFYFQYATKVTLSKIDRSLGQNKLDIDTTIGRIRALATANHHLFKLLSFPLIVSIANCCESIVMTCCMAIFFHAEIHLITGVMYSISPVLALIMITYSVKMNRQIVRTFESIRKQLLNKANNSLTTVQRKNEKGFRERQHCGIHAHELQLFKGYFKMRLFDMATVDLKFLLSAVLFSLQLIVFLVQTN